MIERAGRRSRLTVVVVGGGIAGLATTWALIRAGGVDVTLIERERLLASHASGKSAAIFRLVDGDAAALALALRSRVLFAELGGSIVRQTGALYVGSELELDALVALASKAEVPIEWLGPPAIATRVPALARADAPAGVFVPGDGVIDVHALAQGLARSARAFGATIETGVDVTAIERERTGRVRRVVGGGRSWNADVVVLAGGAWATELGERAGAPLPIRPMRRHLAVLATSPELAANAPVVWRLGTGEVYFRPESGGVLASPCDEEAWPPQDPPASPAAMDRLAVRLSSLAPGLADATVRRSWAGLRTFAPDRGFVAGEDPRAPGLFWIAGLGGRGMTAGVAAGELVAAGILGLRPAISPTLAERIAPARLLASC